MAKIADLVRIAQAKYATAQKVSKSIESVKQALSTIHDISQIKGKQ